MFKHKRKTLLGERKRRRRNIIIVIICIGVILLCIGVFFVLRKEEWQIKEVYIYGGEGISHAQVKEKIWSELHKNYIYVIPRTSLFVYPSDAIIRGIMEEFSRIKYVELDLEFPDKLHVTLKEYEPYVLWCENMIEGIYDPVASSTGGVLSAGDCYYVDETGYIFDTAPSFKEGIYFRYSGAMDTPLRSRLFSQEYFLQLELFRKQLKDRGLDSVSLVINPDETFVLMLKEGGVILLDKDIPLAVAFDNVISVLNDPEANMFPLDAISYIDLRYQRKVYYKLNN